MDEAIVVEIAQQAMITTLLLAAPMLGFGLLVGLAVSIFQATTQIQEQTLAMIPKIVAVLGSVVVFGPWLLSVITDFTLRLFTNMNTFIQ
ncbi:flagellar biosynthesis protein FliQ [Isachenkonia alkalipeptolytica]|uniref:Flagellar biosynthetic protein FliQ n=1 Tax=Isachenkonia alkalipeptolytica TaxID=2565777 RepID=A0AA44BEI2_9CLOT|nr:flagellar biosynthesis protein FliQ [Isachenkonia alkalipeptolytica]NBG87581.1 flagellar biosynthesis protein FliQ [Isachenkonia alkalipeptolytica]